MDIGGEGCEYFLVILEEKRIVIVDAIENEHV